MAKYECASSPDHRVSLGYSDARSKCLWPTDGQSEPGHTKVQVQPMSDIVAGVHGVTRAPRVFISYARESAEHDEAVRDLWVFLRSCGVDAKLDRTATHQRRDWTEWMANQIREADHILVIASTAYRARAGGQVEVDHGRGVQFEASLIRDAFYAN
jgi:TIR domain